MSPSEALKLAEYIEHYLTTGNFSYWQSTVVPQIELMVKAGIATSGVNAMQLAGYGIRNAIAVAIAAQVENQSMKELARQAMIRSAGGRLGGPMVAFICLGVMFALTAKEATAISSNVEEYENYLNRYMAYVLKTAQLGRAGRFPPPKTYKQWLDRDTSSSVWWQ